jgi:GH35 family endo-1,4-beta-xylanase
MRSGIALAMLLLTLLPLSASADWRADTDTWIEQRRQGRMILRVVDAEGNPVSGANIRATLVRHEFWFGTALARKMFRAQTPADEREQYLEIARTYFNSAVHENALKWYGTESKQGQVNYADADRMLEWCEQNGLRMRGHCIFWGVERYVQDWLKALPDDALLREVQRRAREVPARYKGRITEYDVNNEMLHGDFYKKRLGAGIRLKMFHWAHEADPEAVLYVNDFGILTGGDLDRYKEQIQSFLDAGVPVGGIGCQGHFGGKVLPPEQVYARLESLAEFGLPIKITEFDINTTDEEYKAKALEDFYRICFSHPAVNGILMWGFWEGSHWRRDAALFDKDFTPRPAALAYWNLVHDEWKTDTPGITKSDGLFTFKGFHGDYRITVTFPEGETVTRPAVLPSSTRTPVTVTIQEGMNQE